MRLAVFFLSLISVKGFTSLFYTPLKRTDTSFLSLSRPQTSLFADVSDSAEKTSASYPAYFDIREENLTEWLKFSAATSTVLAIVAWSWVLPWGPQGGDAFLGAIQSTIGNTDPAWTITVMLTFFAVAHSGLASLRSTAEQLVGPRAWRVVFALVSLPLALSCISFFVNHAGEGDVLWNLQDVPGVHALVWWTNLVSFFFLSPNTFNLLQVAAVEKPQVYLWKEPTGVLRITRHPQAVGQIMWCAGHAIWLGTTTTIAACAILTLHHLFAIYHGDIRCKRAYGEESFERFVKKSTSIVPFQAIVEGRQSLPSLAEFAHLPYLVVLGGTLAAYKGHPFMQAGAALLGW